MPQVPEDEDNDGPDMTKPLPKLALEPLAWETFLRKWGEGGYPHLRFGQAFWNEFNLNKMTDQARFGTLYEASPQVAKKIIEDNFEFQ